MRECHEPGALPGEDVQMESIRLAESIYTKEQLQSGDEVVCPAHIVDLTYGGRG